jgi:hypothetical protein
MTKGKQMEIFQTQAYKDFYIAHEIKLWVGKYHKINVISCVIPLELLVLIYQLPTSSFI